MEITNLAPKKITFDLKRGIQAQLDKLDRRTDKSIAELIRQRLKEGKQQDFLIAVNAGAQAQQKAGYDSDEDWTKKRGEIQNVYFKGGYNFFFSMWYIFDLGILCLSDLLEQNIFYYVIILIYIFNIACF